MTPDVIAQGILLAAFYLCMAWVALGLLVLLGIQICSSSPTRFLGKVENGLGGITIALRAVLHM
jgi:hypothetical protein